MKQHLWKVLVPEHTRDCEVRSAEHRDFGDVSNTQCMLVFIQQSCAGLTRN
jgi:hypothetical protein